MKLSNRFRGLPLSFLVAALVLLACVQAMRSAEAAAGQRLHQVRRPGGGGGAVCGARGNAPIDLTGYWVSVIAEDWEFRMVTPDKGIFDTLTLNNEGRRVGNTWDPAKDEAAGEQCRGYGAGNIMRFPHAFTSPGRTTRHFDSIPTPERKLDSSTSVLPAPANTEPSWQGYSVAEWERRAGARGGARGSGLQHRPERESQSRDHALASRATSERTALPTAIAPSSPSIMTSIHCPTAISGSRSPRKSTTPCTFRGLYVTTSDFKKLPDATGWNPTPCSAR